MHPYAFSKALRLRKQAEIEAIFQDGSFHQLGLLGVKYRLTKFNYCRFLISVSKSVGPAPDRNRIKRLIREAIRLNKDLLHEHYDICFFVKKSPQRRVNFNYINQKISRMFFELNQLSQKS